jgi:hypothetical protein
MRQISSIVGNYNDCTYQRLYTSRLRLSRMKVEGLSILLGESSRTNLGDLQ